MDNTQEAEMITINPPCRMCGKTYPLKVRAVDFWEYRSPSRRHIQDIFPYLSAAERELLISGTCDNCFKDIFGE